MDIDPNDLNVSTYNPDSHSGGWTLNPKRGVCIIHKPSGIEVRNDMDRSEHRNRAEAMSRLQRLVDDWDVAGRPPPAFAGVAVGTNPVPNPNRVDFAQMRKDMDNGILLCRDGILKALDFGAALQARHQPVAEKKPVMYLAQGNGYISLVDKPVDSNCKAYDASAIPPGIVEGVIERAVDAGVCAAGRFADPDEGGKRVVEVDTDKKEQ